MTLIQLRHRHLARVAVAVATVALSAVLATPSPSAASTEDRFHVLVFHHAESFYHASIPVAVQTFEQLGQEHGFAVTSSDDPEVFSDETLADVDVVAFVLTTGDAVPEAAQRAAFERWHRAGGGWLGVHSAADTAYDWSYYGELLAGAYFLAHPIQQPGTAIVEQRDHPATAHLDETWEFAFEEFYSFVRSPREDTTVLVSMDESSYEQNPNTSNLPMDFSQGEPDPDPEGVDGTMGDHPMVWCHDVAGGRVFYTAFGHEGYLYADPDFRQHLVGGLDAVAGAADAPCHTPRTTAVPERDGTGSGGPDQQGAAPRSDDRPAADEPPARTAPPTATRAAAALPATGGGVSGVGLAILLLLAAALGRATATAARGPR
jgi:uncharacterized protein